MFIVLAMLCVLTIHDYSTGLPPSLEGYDSASDSEEELDEADEDSNGILSSFYVLQATI